VSLEINELLFGGNGVFVVGEKLEILGGCVLIGLVLGEGLK
jgi:hypothetical protein